MRDALPGEWLGCAEELGDAAVALWHVRQDNLTLSLEGLAAEPTSVLRVNPAQPRAFMLLAALALENALKGLIVANNPSLIARGSLSPILRTHRLTALTKHVPGLKLTNRGSRVLSTCEEAMPYWSRYPVPLTLKELRQADVVPPSFCDDFKRLHNSLCKKLYNQVKNGWDSEAGARHVQMRSTRYGDEVRLKSRIR